MWLEQILNQYGYPGYDVLGKSTSYLFWVMVQHADHDPEFQKRVLYLRRAEVEANNTDARDYAYLTDRVQINTGEEQIYGTQ